MSDFIDEGLLKDYFDEAYSQIDIMETNLLSLEKNTNDKESIDSIFRAAHTLKGGSATVQMDELTKFTHLLEDSMDEIRSGKVKVTPEIVDVLLDALDVIKNMVRMRSEGSIYDNDISACVKNLSAISKGSAEPQAKPSKTKDSAKKTDKSADEPIATEKSDVYDDEASSISEYDLLEINESNPENLPLYKLIVSFDESNPMRTVGAIQVFTSLRDVALVIKTIPDFDDIYSEVFHKDVTYILASGNSADKLKEYATIPDTTTDVRIFPISSDGMMEVKTTVTKSKEREDGKIKDSAVNGETTDSGRSSKVTPPSEMRTPANFDAVNKEIDESKFKAQKDRDAQKIVTTSVLRVESSRIDDLLNLVSEIVINKATFNQISAQFFENLEYLGFTLSDYKDKLRLIIEKTPSLIDKIKDGASHSQIKKEIQNEFSTLTNQFDNFTSLYKGAIDRFRSTAQNLDRISSSLQEGVMRVRMVQIKQIFTRFPRLVRDLSRDLRKEIELVIEGEDTEIDKAMIDDLIDPLIHIVRNSIDHGFETPEEREKAGKKNPATLKLSALNEGNLISISIIDDGKGINVEKVKKKAIERGLITSDKSLRDQDAFNLIFEPGFSTADKVTSVSGRGVGLDVVKKNIEKLSGSIRVNSEPGKGTSFSIKLPLTLAIIQGLMIKVQEEIYALPISSVLESIRIKPENIKMIDNYEVINVRDDVLSLLRLNRLFKIEDNEEAEFFFVVIVGAGDKKIGLLVDSLIGEEDIVIKPLKDKYTSTPGIAGATILGDGTVSLILDVSQLIDLGLKEGIETNQKKRSKKNNS
ncbi:MAG TPA: chemotaxis protein CheA [Spirochaetota bacterium]|nr:MAG: Chemotaxis protein CheA [Spirochaetes bacterium ADurb.Bin133]HPY88268.1 chemotaxis protein CheA [Spirochaetota bacterium]